MNIKKNFIKNIVYNRGKKTLYTLFFIVLLFFTLLYITPYKTNASNFIEISSCEEAMLTAFSTADTMQNTKFTELLKLEKVTAVAKSTNIASYARTYECHAQNICSAVRNPNKAYVIPSFMGKCHSITVEDLEKELNTDFSTCNEMQSYATLQYFSRCEEFKDIKIKQSKMFLTTEFMSTVHDENNSLLGEKILDLRKKMSILIEKVRTFSINFNKVIIDIDCTSPDPSGE